MDTYKNEMIWYSIGTNEPVWHFNGTVNSTFLHRYHINIVVKSHVKDPGQTLINDNFTQVSTIKSTFKE